MCNRLRFLMLSIASLGIGGACLYISWSSIATEVFSFTSRRRAFTFVFTRADDPFPFAIGVATVGIVGVIMVAVALWQVFVVLHPKHPKSERVVAEAIARVEHDGPSGLKPLWVGLLVAAFAFALYAGV